MLDVRCGGEALPRRGCGYKPNVDAGLGILRRVEGIGATTPMELWRSERHPFRMARWP